MTGIYNNIDKYRKTIRLLSVNKDGKANTSDYYCPLSDMSNSKFIRTAAIGDGSCMLHSIFTYQDRYYPLSKNNKEKFIEKLRTQMANSLKENPEKIWQNIDNNYEVYMRIRNYLEQLETPISKDKIIYIWGLISTDIDRIERTHKNGKLSIKQIQTIIHEKFLKYLKPQLPVQSLLLKSYLSMNKLTKKEFREKNPKIYKKIRQNLEKSELYEVISTIDMITKNAFIIFIDEFIEDFKDPSNWLGVEELRFIQNYLDINIFFLRGNNYGMPYIFGDEAKRYYKSRKNNLILIWSGVHYELISINNNGKRIYKFGYDSTLIKRARYMTSNRPRLICEKNILLSPFYKDCKSKLSMTKIKQLVKKYQRKGEENINDKIKLLLQKNSKFNFGEGYHSKIIHKRNINNKWIKETTKNIEDCFSNSYLDFNNNKIVEITKKREQVAIALMNVKYPLGDIKNFGDFELPKGKIGYIHTLCVAKNHRGKSICKKYLLKAIIKYAKKIKINSLILAVYIKNRGAIKCYRANGFKNMGKFNLNRKKPN